MDRLIIQGAEMGVIEAVTSVNWESESYPLYNDFAAIPFFALLFPSIRFFLDRFVLEKLGRQLVLRKGVVFADSARKERRKLSKFKESALKFIFFLSAEILGLTVTYNEPWFTNTRYFWVGPGEQIWPDKKTKAIL